MRTFKYAHVMPPGGVYFYEVDIRGRKVRLEDTQMDVLVSRCMQLLANNQLTVPDRTVLHARVEHYVCTHVPEGFCRGAHEEGDKQLGFITASQVMEFTRLIFAKAKATLTGKGASFCVPVAEAERRAAICALCPKNMTTICTSCDGLKEYGAKYLVDPDKQRTSYDDRLRVCEECGCLLRFKVHVALDVLKQGGGKHDYPPQCWLKDTK
jgi:hypothetical protein